MENDIIKGQMSIYDIDKRKSPIKGRNCFGVDAKAKENSKNINLTIKRSLYNTIIEEAKGQKGKASTIIKNVLIELYNENVREFIIPIEPRFSEPNSAICVYMPKPIAATLERLSAETNKSKSEIVEELLIKYLKREY